MDSATDTHGPRLPVELLLLICGESESQGTLNALCRTWRAFLAPAQLRMYRAVDLVGCPMHAVRAWASAVTRKKNLAERVHSLSIQLPDVRQLSPDDATKITLALVACVNLKKLRFLGLPGIHSGRSLEWLLHMCPFQLTEFATSYFDCTSLSFVKFLCEQNELRTLDILPGSTMAPGAWERWSPRPALPSLTGFKGSFLQIPENRPFERLELWLASTLDLALLPRYAQTLTTLNLFSDSTINTSLLLLRLAHILPALTHFAIVEATSPEHYTYGASFPIPTAQFSRIETLTIVGNAANFRRWFRSMGITRADADSAELMRAAAKELAESHATLRRVVLGAKDPEGQAKKYTSTRDSSGEINTIIEDGIDFEAVSMFWV